MKFHKTLALLCILAACKKDDAPAPSNPTGPVTQKEINNWMLDSMRYFYLWNESLPAKADTSLKTTDFFASLKNSADRFSFVYQPNNLATYPKYMLYIYGMDFDIIAWPGAPGGAIGVVKLVIPGTPAAQAGIQRGTYFTQINGTAVTSANAETLSNGLLNAKAASFTLATVNNNTVTEGQAVTLSAGSYAENSIYLSNTRQVAGKMVAYLFYNYFNDVFDSDVKAAFQQFKAAGATELILDIRYNPGGSVAAAAMINALIAPGISDKSIFAEYSGNKRLGLTNVSYANALAVPESGGPISYSSLASGQLNLSRVFILTGPGTTSAAELTINTLKPYTQVIQIGETTYGKDKGAIIITDTRNPQRIDWAMMPITYNLLNAKGLGGYTQGITPQYVVDEMGVQPLTALGDNADPLIAKALSIISGNGREREVQPVRHYFDTRTKPANDNIVRIPR
jgi:carboxyl-terminal processing protease